METMENKDIFTDVEDTEVTHSHADPAKQLWLLPEGRAEWFIAKTYFDKPKDIKDCTKSLVARFLSWQIAADQQAVYMGSGVSAPGTLRNQLVVRYHPIPEGFFGDDSNGRAPCRLQFGETCGWCGEKTKADKRFPRDSQPAGYFKEVIAKFKPKDKTLMLANIYTPEENGTWTTDGKVYAFEFSNFVRNGRPFVQIINDRANDADKRIRIDKKTYAGYVSPVAIKITFSWPAKAGKPEHGQFSTWAPTDATPFPVEAGGPDVSQFSKEWAIGIAKHDPAAWINRDACAKAVPAEAGKYVYGLFTGEIQPRGAELDLDTADFTQLLAVAEKHKALFADIDLTVFDYNMVDALRAVVIGTLNAAKEQKEGGSHAD